jgi:hypothetical protein
VHVQYREVRPDHWYGVVDVGAEEDPADRTQRVIDHRGVDIDGSARRGCRSASVRQARGLVGHHIDVTSSAPVRKHRRNRPALLPPDASAAGKQAVAEVRGDLLVEGSVLRVAVRVAGQHLFDVVRMSQR